MKARLDANIVAAIVHAGNRAVPDDAAAAKVESHAGVDALFTISHESV
jgi:hypothetical protein